jgi:hypothetical protein
VRTGRSGLAEKGFWGRRGPTPWRFVFQPRIIGIATVKNASHFRDSFYWPNRVVTTLDGKQSQGSQFQKSRAEQVAYCCANEWQ